MTNDAKDCEQYCSDNTCCTCRNREWYRLYEDYKSKEQDYEHIKELMNGCVNQALRYDETINKIKDTIDEMKEKVLNIGANERRYLYAEILLDIDKTIDKLRETELSCVEYEDELTRLRKENETLKQQLEGTKGLLTTAHKEIEALKKLPSAND